ncbi:hypothetical protein [Psychrobacter sp. FDAARGOS_221]|uniref:hypothetical protein n=1 Tax=Psychrobacter sp. FDAARGOS_221 TaxID=1975705 RepID=UPI00187D2FA8|nr:hypothetical protein [Psychrobacter sp. FDAARGOS_221]
MSNDANGVKATLKGEAIDKSLEQHESPDNLAEATTVALDDDALGGHATEDDVKK